MTLRNSTTLQKKYGKEIGILFISVLITFSLLAVSVVLSEELSESAKEGMLLSIRTVIPSIFPFLIISDLVIRYIKFDNVLFLRKFFERLFSINGSALGVFICGILCGFPIGAKLGLELYNNGKISKSECERLIAFSNNASPGYIIGVVGVGLFNDLKIGIALYIATVFSAIAIGILTKESKHISKNSASICWQKYSFVDSIKNAAEVCLTICAFITTFSIVCGLIKKYVKSSVLRTLLFCLTEIGNATALMSDSCILSFPCTMALVSFCISFSGLCIFAQTQSLASKSNVNMGKYLMIKLLQGCVSAVITFLFFKLQALCG